MKVFISWSGNHSHSIAQALRNWLPYIFTDIRVFVSSEDVRKGKRWLLEISKELATTNFGIVCLTSDNLESLWILFEAGALSKLKSAHVCTLLFGTLRNADIQGPLSHFQSTAFNKSDFFKLIQSMNLKLGKVRLDEQRLNVMFEKWWPDLQSTIEKTSKGVERSASPHRSQEELLYEVLELTREIARNVQSPEASDFRKLQMLLNMPVSEIAFSEDTRKFLLNANIETLGRLARKTESELKKDPRLRPFILSEIKEQLDALGLSLDMAFHPDLLME